MVRQIWEYEFKVEYHDCKVGVKLEQGVCDYGYWQLKGIPCVHALACLNTIRNSKKKDYTEKYFHTETWKKYYFGIIHPLTSMDLWSRLPRKDQPKLPKVKR